MSGALAGIALGIGVSSALEGLINTPTSIPDIYVGDAYIIPYRAIGTIIPDILIEENNHDELEITQHPVQTGATISDHAYMRPMEVSLQVGWSNSGHSPSYVNDVYTALRRLQSSRAPFEVFTGKRHYINMLIASLTQTSNSQFGDFSLMVHVIIREIIIVNTGSIQAPPASQALPTKTVSPSSGGASQVAAKKPMHLKACPVATNTSLNAQSSGYNKVGLLPASSIK